MWRWPDTENYMYISMKFGYFAWKLMYLIVLASNQIAVRFLSCMDYMAFIYCMANPGYLNYKDLWRVSSCFYLAAHRLYHAQTFFNLFIQHIMPVADTSSTQCISRQQWHARFYWRLWQTYHTQTSHFANVLLMLQR